MAAQALPDKVDDKEYKNFVKFQLALYCLKYPLCTFIDSEVQCLHKSLILQIYGNLAERPPLCCINLLNWNKDITNWELRAKKGCNSKCDDWFQKLLSCHINQKSKKIYWMNSDMSSWPSNAWECAKVFIPCELTRSISRPEECNVQELTMLIANCKHFHHRLSPQGHDRLKKISVILENLNQDDELKLSDGDKNTFIEDMIELLEDHVYLKSRQDCKTAVEEIRDIDRLTGPELVQRSKGLNGPALSAKINDRPSADLLTGNTDGKPHKIPSMYPGHEIKRSKKLEICIPFNPRCGRINKWTADVMEDCIGEQIGDGSFGIVYKAKFTLEDLQETPGGKKHEFVIKKIEITEDVNRKSYKREIEHGKIVHPFINPVFARAESDKGQFKERYSYLVFPYMKNKDLRSNIDTENKVSCISQTESNSKIWTRCTYQILQAVDYLHTNLIPFRGMIFHRDLTSKNILLDENFNIRIGDFGIAVEANVNASKATLTRKLGTKGYHPPKMNEDDYKPYYDVFSIGVDILEILTGETAKLKTGPKEYLYNKFDNIDELLLYLDDRAKSNTFAKWDNIGHRNLIAELALEAVSCHESKMKAGNLLKKLEDLNLEPDERYQSSGKFDVCASCCVNTPVQLPLKGQECLKHAIKSMYPCQPYCVYCLMNHSPDPILCPKHGNSRPPMGDHTYGVFVAGNDLKQNTEILNVFKSDVKKVVETLRDMHLFKSASWKDHFKIVEPNDCENDNEMMTRIKESFEELNKLIMDALVNNNMKQNDRLSNSLFIFYFTGHGSSKNGLYLGGKNETMDVKWIMKMLHVKLRVDQALVILDCCTADGIDFVHYPDRDVNARKKVRIIQLSSCDKHEKSFASHKRKSSYFTHFLCQGLKGFESTGPKNNVIFCDDSRTNSSCLLCTQYHTLCSSDQIITLARLVEYMRGHLKLVGDASCKVKMTLIHNAQGEINMPLGYYNSDQRHILIRIFPSKGEHIFHLRKTYPDEIESIKQDIIKYTVDKQIECEVLNFHQSCSETYENISKDNITETVKYTSRFLAIYAKYNNDMEMEINNVYNIYNAWTSGLELEARVRDKVEDLHHGYVRLKKITKSTVHNLKCDEDYLKLSADLIQVQAGGIAQALRKIRDLVGQDGKDPISEVLSTCINTLGTDQKISKMLQFLLYDTFSVLKLV